MSPAFNLVKYVEDKVFDIDQFIDDIAEVVRAMDNVIDRTIYPLEAQRIEAQQKRRMGWVSLAWPMPARCLGFLTPVNSSWSGLRWYRRRRQRLQYELRPGKRERSIPLWNHEDYSNSAFIKTLPNGCRKRSRFAV